MEVRRVSKRFYCYHCKKASNILIDPDHSEEAKCPECNGNFLEMIEKGANCPSGMRHEEKEEVKKEQNNTHEDYSNNDQEDDPSFEGNDHEEPPEHHEHSHDHSAPPFPQQAYYEHPHVQYSYHPSSYEQVHVSPGPHGVQYSVNFPSSQGVHISINPSHSGMHHEHAEEEDKYAEPQGFPFMHPGYMPQMPPMPQMQQMSSMPQMSQAFFGDSFGAMPGFPQPFMGHGFTNFDTFFPGIHINEFFNVSDPDFSENFEFDNDGFASNYMSNFGHINIADLVRLIPAESGNTKPPASKDSVKKLPIIKIEKKHCKKGEKDALEPPSCAICCSNINLGEDAQLIPCGHMFHPACIKPWFQQHNTCPICRYELPTDDPTYEQQRRQNVQTRNGERRAREHRHAHAHEPEHVHRHEHEPGPSPSRGSGERSRARGTGSGRGGARGSTRGSTHSTSGHTTTHSRGSKK